MQSRNELVQSISQCMSFANEQEKNDFANKKKFVN